MAMITPVEVEAAQNAWADGFLRIGQQQQTSPAAARKEAEKFVDELYGHGRKPVLMKPVNTTSKPFRTTRAGVVSSFVGGNEEFPEDTGFAIGPVRWDAIRFDNVGFSVEGSQALAMGHYHFRDSFTGNESALEYTFGYFRDEDGKLRINFHFSSAPYRNHSNQTNSDDITAEQVKAALKTFGDTVVDIGKYYAKGWSYKEHTLMFVDQMFAYDLGPVLFKPAEVKEHPFRLERAGALSYFRGLNDDFPEDEGFALKPWARFSFSNYGIILQEETAIAMGNYVFETKEGETTEAQYTIGFKKDAEGSLRINYFFASIPSDGAALKFGEEPREQNLTEMNMEAAQVNWAKKLVEVGNSYVMKGKYRKTAETLVDECYAYSVRPVLFKPAEARLIPFRTTRAGAVSYFAGGNPVYPEDWGFALRPWASAKLSSEAVVIHGTQGLVMGHAYYDDTSGIQRKGEYAMGFVKSMEGTIRINMHHAHFPNYTEVRKLRKTEIRAPLQRSQVLQAQKDWGDGIVELGKYGRKVLEVEAEAEIKGLVGIHAQSDVNRSVLWTRAASFVDKLYAFNEGPVMLKVTEASPSTRFRTTRLGSVSWLIGANREFPSDRGFALRPWNEVRFVNEEIAISGDAAQAMGSMELVDDSGSTRELQYLFGYKRDLDGRLRIEVAQLALPFGASYRSMWDNLETEAISVGGALKHAAGGIAGVVGGAAHLAGHGGTKVVLLVGSLGVAAAFLYYFMCSWGQASKAGFATPGGMLPQGGFSPPGWPNQGQLAGGFQAPRTSYAQRTS